MMRCGKMYRHCEASLVAEAIQRFFYFLDPRVALWSPRDDDRSLIFICQMVRKILEIITVLTIGWESPSFAETHPMVSIQKELIATAAASHDLEREIEQLKKDQEALEEEELKKKELLNSQSHSLFVALHHLRHVYNYSPLLCTLSASSPAHLIHTTVLLRSVLPYLNKQNQSLLSDLASLSKLRVTLQQTLKKQKECQHKHEVLEAKIQRLLGEKSTLVASFSDIRAYQRDFLREFSWESLSKINAPFSSVKDEDVNESHQLRMKIPAGGLIRSPVTGNVLQIHKNEEEFFEIHLKTGEYAIVMGGLGSVNCKQGDDILTGEPIGKARGTLSSNEHYPFFIDVWKSGAKIPPTLFTSAELPSEKKP